jgi:hypothetical protein
MKTSLLLSLVAFAVASPCFAHVEIGTYSGLSDAGAPCSVQVLQQSFEGGMHHPLNERVQVQVETEQFTLAHPAVVDAEKSLASFNHDVLQAVVAIQGGARAVILEMDHSPGKDGPSAFHLVTSDWRTGTGTTAHCRGLKFNR